MLAIKEFLWVRFYPYVLVIVNSMGKRIIASLFASPLSSVVESVTPLTLKCTHLFFSGLAPAEPETGDYGLFWHSVLSNKCLEL